MLTTLLLSASVFAATTVPSGPAGQAFYKPPARLPAGTHGDVIWTRPLTTSAALPDAAQNILVLYHTTSVTGKDVAVSGTIAIPAGTPPRLGWPVISWTHGTTGDAPQCAPSLDAPSNGMHDYLQLVETLLDGFVRSGYAVVQTDYEGQGTPGIHPYLVGESEGRDAIDMVRAAREVDPDIGWQWVVMGHSQGGQSSLFAASLADDWAPELKLIGAVAMAPASGLGPFIQYLTTAQTPLPPFAYAGLLFEGYAASYPAVQLDQFLTPSAIAALPQTQDRCVDALRQPDSWGGIVPASAFKPQPNLTPLLTEAAANEPATLHLTVPVLLLQGGADTTIPQRATDALDKQLCANGTKTDYQIYPGAGHEPLVPDSGADAKSWIDARFAGTPATSGCSPAT
jgi:alpha-beta hydrolase superfamily lysophospholipase